MDRDYLLLTEKEAMWAEMLMQVLKDNNIPYAALPVHGAGLILKTGMHERFSIYVPDGYFQQASELMQVLFSDSCIQEEPFDD